MTDLEKHLAEIRRLKLVEELLTKGDHMSVKEILMGMKTEAEAVVAKYDAALVELAADLKAEKDAGFDEGVKQAGIPATDKLYTEADLQAEKVFAAKAAVAALELEVDAKIAAAVDAQTAEIVAGIENAEIDNMALVAKYKKA